MKTIQQAQNSPLQQANVIPACAGIQEKPTKFYTDSGFPIESGMTNPPWRASRTSIFPCHKSPGFTLLEVMIATVIFGMIMGGAIGVFVMCQELWHAASLNMATSREDNMALARLVYGVGSNNGLRAASSISVDTGKKGMWTGTGHVYPPAPGDPAHFLNDGLPDGSWRLTCSNVFDGERWIDFNKEASNIVLWVQAPPSEPHKETRQLICNYVSDAVVTNNASGVTIRLTIIRQKGRFTSTNQVGTFVKRRN